MSRPLHAIILDFDGVVANSEGLHLQAMQDVLTGTDLPLTRESYYERYLGFDDRGVFTTLAADHGRSLDDAALERLCRDKASRYDALAAAGDLLFPGVAAFIRQAAAAVPVGIASGALTHEIEHVLTAAGLRDLVLAVVGADQTAQSKPAPDPYLEAFARLSAATGRALEGRRTVAVEDSRWGLESARAAGLRTVAVTSSYPADALAPHAELVVSGLGALSLDALDRLCGG
ncbi:MAG: HAD family hydrolase [Vicinamibacterales bacterium]